MQWTNNDLFCSSLQSRPCPEQGKILVTGASGYIGGRLVPELIARGYEVRVMVRGEPDVFRLRWPDAEIIVADALKPESLHPVFEGIHAAYYLIHSLLLGQGNFESADIEAAVNFRNAAAQHGTQRIIYLGGLGDVQGPLSPHLDSRMQVADELMNGGVPTTVLRAAIIIGSGSASYEMLEHLVRNCPVLPIPRWAKTRCQPIAIRDVIKYLVGVLETPETMWKYFDIGGSDVLTYEMILRQLADIYKIKRLFLPLPVSNIKLFAYIVSLITPVPWPIAMCLMQSCHHDVVCQNEAIKYIVPFPPLTYKEALLRALSREEQDKVSTRWSDAYPPAHELAIKLHELKSPPHFTFTYVLESQKSASALFKSITQVGGKAGWFRSSMLMRIRGMVDRLLMGVGSARGRKKNPTLQINDVIDFWRVEDLVPDMRLLLRAEMKLPGRAWLEFYIKSEDDRRRLKLNAFFQPRGFFGKLYWFVFLPFHLFIFSDICKQIERRS